MRPMTRQFVNLVHMRMSAKIVQMIQPNKEVNLYSYNIYYIIQQSGKEIVGVG